MAAEMHSSDLKSSGTRDDNQVPVLDMRRVSQLNCRRCEDCDSDVGNAGQADALCFPAARHSGPVGVQPGCATEHGCGRLQCGGLIGGMSEGVSNIHLAEETERNGIFSGKFTIHWCA